MIGRTGFVIFCLSLLLIEGEGVLVSAVEPVMPAQPKTGPGGSDYPHAELTVQKFGEGYFTYWVFAPKNAKGPLPIVGFIHGWGVFNPDPYEVWVRHIARRGSIVIFPKYQMSITDSPTDMTGITGRALSDALKVLGTNGLPDGDQKKFALVGHSMGGTISANLANDPQRHKLPVPKVMMAIEPGDSKDAKVGALRRFLPSIFKGTKNVDAETLMLVVVGEVDRVVNRNLAVRMFTEAKNVPLANRDFITFRTDPRDRRLVANHFIPLVWPASRSWYYAPNAHDYLGLWKLFDGLTDAAFFGKNREYALGGTPEQKSLGVWSDGVPVKPLDVTDTP